MGPPSTPKTPKGNNQKASQPSSNELTLKYLLNILENITSVKTTRDELSCGKLYDQTITLFIDSLSLDNKISLINIIFNLNFNLTEPRVLSKDFMKLFYKTYKDEDLKSQRIKRKIIAIVVAASALE